MIFQSNTKYGNKNTVESAALHLRGTYALFVEIHAIDINRLRAFRDKKGAHEESRVQIDGLPSHDVFETLLEFSEAFYKIVSEHFLDIGPAMIGRQVGLDLIKVLKRIGVDTPLYDFKPE